MALDHKSLLSEFPQQVIAPLLELAAEVLTVDRLTVLMARQVGTIQAAHDCWQAALACFQASMNLWKQLPHDDLLAAHERLLERLIRNAEERKQFYSVTDHDRAAYNAGRDHGMPLPLA